MNFLRVILFVPLLSLFSIQPMIAFADSQDLSDVEKAHEMVDQGKVEDALSLLDAVTSRNPSFAPAFFHRGMIFMQGDELERSLSNFSKALDLDPKFTQAYLGRSMVYFLRQDLDATIKDLNQALNLDSELAVAYYNRGIAFSYKQDFGKAFDDLSQAKKYGYPVEEELLQQVWGLGNTDSVVAEANAQIVENPEDGPAYYNRAVARYYRKEYAEALGDLHKAKSLGVDVESEFITELETIQAGAPVVPTPA